MFGMGLFEILIVLVMSAFLLAAPIVAIVWILRASQPRSGDRLQQLEEENLRLRKLLAENGIPHGGLPPKK